MRGDDIKLIYSPVVDLFQFERAGAVGCNSLGQTSGCVVDIVEVVAEIHSMQFRPETRRPAKGYCIRVYELGAVNGIGISGSLGWN